MKKLSKLSVFAMSFVLILAFGSGCKKENPAFLPVLTTNEVSSITFSSARSGGSITSDAGSTVIARGVCWSSTETPTIANNKTSDGGGIGSFTSSITGLSPETTYYVRAYATNSDGTAYGSAYQFTTSAKPAFLLTTNEISFISYNSAKSGGRITSDGGSTIIARGVCWSSSANPTIANNKTSDSGGIGSFTSSITGLSPETTYFVRAYATNSDGTAYGSAYQFTTSTNPAFLPVLTTHEISSISYNSATSGGSITSDGGSTIVTHGVCWSSSANPTIANNKTSDGGGIGSFTSSITGLSDGTTYYVRAYATNSDGTAYGSVYQFTTIATAFIPAGTFTMGSPESEVSRFSNETQHEVTLTAFRMSKYEITNAQYAAFLNAKSIGNDGLYAAGEYPTKTLIYEDFLDGLHYSGSQWVSTVGCETSPVINVTWYGAVEFAAYVGGSLPTEAQWEYACRAGTTTPFNTGTCLTNLQANYDWRFPYGSCTNSVTTVLNKLQPVGTYAANAYGLYDMHGNVSEWCADWYGSYPTSAQTNPTGDATGSDRMIRGGSRFNYAKDCRSASRNYSDSDSGSDIIGFRVVFVP